MGVLCLLLGFLTAGVVVLVIVGVLGFVVIEELAPKEQGVYLSDWDCNPLSVIPTITDYDIYVSYINTKGELIWSYCGSPEMSGNVFWSDNCPLEGG